MNTLNYFYTSAYNLNEDQLNDGITNEEMLGTDLKGMSKGDLRRAVYLVGRGYSRYKDRMPKKELTLYYAITNRLYLMTFGPGPEIQRRETIWVSQRSFIS